MRDLKSLEIRIDGCIKNLEKARKTLTRHQAQAEKKLAVILRNGWKPDVNLYNDGNHHEEYWAVCEYESKLDDIKSTQKKIAELSARLEKYHKEQKEEQKKQEVPNVPSVEEFLKNWKEAEKEYYTQQVKAIKAWKSEYRKYYTEQMGELKRIYGWKVNSMDSQVRAEKKARNLNYDYEFNYLKNHFTQNCINLASYSEEDFHEKLEYQLNNEVNCKRIDLYQRCSAVVGVITDAKGLTLGNNGSINGVVVGEEGKANVRTIFAGGYNIQCLHYRVLVNPIKE